MKIILQLLYFKVVLWLLYFKVLQPRLFFLFGVPFSSHL